MLDNDVKKYLKRKEIAAFYFFSILGILVLEIPYMIITLPLFFILSPLFYFTGEVPNWTLKIRDLTNDTYFRWLRERYRQKAVRNRNGAQHEHEQE